LKNFVSFVTSDYILPKIKKGTKHMLNPLNNLINGYHSSSSVDASACGSSFSAVGASA
jgi:hypothetical protein